MAELIINLKKLRYNLNFLQNYCKLKGLEMIGVVKGCYAVLPIIHCFYHEGLTTLGLSKVSVVNQIAPFLHQKPLLITLPSKNQAAQVTRFFKASLNSEISTIRALAKAANQNRAYHEILLMVDNGDLREGVMPDKVLKTVQEILKIKSTYLKFAGLGANLACCSGTLPSHENLTILQDLAEEIESKLAVEVKTISIGGSVVLDWMQSNNLPPRINQIRLGEAIFLGNIPAVNRPHPSLYTDVLTFMGEVLELKEKPSTPTGQIGRNLLGKVPVFKNRGHRKRAIINFGLLDTEPTGLTPRLAHLERISCTSNYTIYDVTDCEKHIQTGDVLKFDLNFRAMVQSFLSPYIQIKVIDTEYHSPSSSMRHHAAPSLHHCEPPIMLMDQNSPNTTSPRILSRSYHPS